jgi:hypothetical protein
MKGKGKERIRKERIRYYMGRHKCKVIHRSKKKQLIEHLEEGYVGNSEVGYKQVKQGDKDIAPIRICYRKRKNKQHQHEKEDQKMVKKENSEAFLHLKASPDQWNRKILSVFEEVSEKLEVGHHSEEEQELNSLELIYNEENIKILDSQEIKEKEEKDQLVLDKWL